MMKKTLMLLVLVLFAAAAATLLLAGGGPSAAQAPATPPAPPTASSAPGPNPRFYTVAQKLDAGGSFYLYTDLKDQLKQFMDLLRPYVMKPGMPPAALRIYAGADKVLERLGLYGLHDLGLSVIPDGDLNRTKCYISAPEGRQKGILALLGGAPHPLSLLDRASSATLVAAAGDFDTAAAWALVRQIVADIGGVTGTTMVDQSLAQIKQQPGLDVEAIVASLGGECALFLDQDPAYKLVIPLGRKPIMIDSPRLTLMARVKDATLYNALKDWMVRQKAPLAPEVTEGKLKLLGINIPPNPVWVVAPVLAFDGEYLYLSTHAAMVRQLAAPAKTPLRATPEFQRLAAGLPTEGNAVSYVSPRLGAVIQEVVQGIMGAYPAMGTSEPAMAQVMLEAFQRNSAQGGAMSVRVNQPDGVLTISRSKSGAAQYIGAMLVAPVAVLAAIAVPNFLEAQGRSKVARVRADMRTMTLAIEAYHIDNNSHPAWATPPEPNANGPLGRPDQPTFRIKRDKGDPLFTLTTPIPYISSYFGDPFAPAKGSTYSYWAPPKGSGYILWSTGPDGKYDLNLGNIGGLYDPAQPAPSAALLGLTFDPSNGTTSPGDVYRIKQ